MPFKRVYADVWLRSVSVFITIIYLFFVRVFSEHYNFSKHTLWSWCRGIKQWPQTYRQKISYYFDLDHFGVYCAMLCGWLGSKHRLTNKLTTPFAPEFESRCCRSLKKKPLSTNGLSRPIRSEIATGTQWSRPRKWRTYRIRADTWSYDWVWWWIGALYVYGHADEEGTH